MADITIGMIVNAIAKGFGGVNKEVDGLADSFGKAAIQQQILDDKSQEYQKEVKRLAEDVRTGKISMEDAARAADKLGNELGIAGSKTQKARMGFADLKAGLDIVRTGFDTVVDAARRAAVAISEGADLQLARSQFDNLTNSINSTSDSMLTNLRAATQGMTSDADLIAGASDIISLGLANTEEDTVRLATAVGTLGLDMQQVILTFANNSKARLDALGLSVEGVTSKAKELEDQGFVGDAFDEAVLIGLEEKMKLLGNTAETTAGQIMILESDWANLTNTMKESAAITAGPMISSLNAAIKHEKLIQEAIAAGVVTRREAVAITNQVTVDLGRNATATNVAAEAEIQLRKAIDESAAAFEAHAEAAAEADRRVLGVTDTMIFGAEAITEAQLENMRSASEAAFANSELSDKVQQLGTHMSESESIVRAGNAAFNERVSADKAVAEATAEVAAESEALAAKESALTAKTAAFFNTLDDVDKLEEYEKILGDTSETSVRIAGRTGEQQEALEELQSQYEKAQDTISDYEFGVKGLNLEEGERNDKIAEQQELMGQLQGAMDPLLEIQSEYTTIVGDGSVNQELLNEKIFDSIQAFSDDAAAIAIAGEALGIYTEEEANARLEAALLDEFIRRQIEAWDGTKSGALEAKSAIEGYIGQLNAIPSEVTTNVTTNFRTTGDPNPVVSAGPGGGDLPPGQAAAFATGGFTGSQGGIVHPNELVIPSGILNQGAGAMVNFAQQHVPGGVSGGAGGININGPLIGQVSMRQGENVGAFAQRVSTMVSQQLGELN